MSRGGESRSEAIRRVISRLEGVVEVEVEELESVLLLLLLLSSRLTTIGWSESRG